MRRGTRYVFAGVLCMGAMLVAAPALAQETPETAPEVVTYTPNGTPVPDEVEVGGEVVERGTPAEVQATGTPGTPGTPGTEVLGATLPVTGGDLVALAVIGAALVGLGALAVSRRHARSEPSA